MKCKVASFGDTHLGYRQYGSLIREDDFAKAFFDACRIVAKFDPDIVLHVGDLTHHPHLTPQTLSQIEYGFGTLGSDFVPPIVIPGNHDYTPGQNGWLDYLDTKGVISYISGASIKPVPEHLRIKAIPWSARSTVKVLDDTCRREINLKANGQQPLFSILMLHYGLDGIVPHTTGIPSDMLPLVHQAFDLVVAGHIHRPYDIQNFWFSSGSTEMTSIDQLDWMDRSGVYLFDIDTDREPVIQATLVPTKKRKWETVELDVTYFNQHQFGCAEKLGDQDTALYLEIVGAPSEPVSQQRIREVLLPMTIGAPLAHLNFKYTNPGFVRPDAKRTEQRDVLADLLSDPALVSSAQRVMALVLAGKQPGEILEEIHV